MAKAKGGGAAVSQAKRLGIYHVIQAHFGYEIGTNGKRGKPQKKRMRANVIKITERPPGL